LSLQDISDCGFKAFLIANEALAASLSPPVLPHVLASVALAFLQSSRAPSLELISDVFRFPIRRYNHGYMVRAGVYGVKLPMSDLAMIADRVGNDCPFVVTK
jgi:hypothetical protein